MSPLTVTYIHTGDIGKVRTQTIGAEEHLLKFERGMPVPYDIAYTYFVGGFES